VDSKPSSARAGRRPAEQAEHTRTAILDAALRLFADRGYDTVSLRDIATGAGVTHGLIRHHFGAKEQVWQAVVDRADEVYRSALQPRIQRALAEPDPAAALEIVVRGLTTTTARHPEIARLLLAEGTRGGPRLRQILTRMAPLRAALAAMASHDPDTLFLTLILLTAAPFALAELTREVTGTPANANHQAETALRLLRP
jgi:AcrR family transcriptional regulator